MSQLGIGVMLAYLTDNTDSVNAYRSALNKVIAALELKDNALHFAMEDGTKFKLFDDAQSCCEDRYMTTDDDLAYYVGSTLRGVEIADAPNIKDRYGTHEVAFLKVTTSLGTFTMETHNVHNGYYGGFAVKAKSVQ